MTDELMPDTELRFRRALQQIADTHEPNVNNEKRPHRSSNRTWWLAAACVAIIAAGLAAVALVAKPQVSAPTQSTPAVDTTVAASTTSELTATSTTSPAVDLRFNAPLSSDVIATLEPAPSSPATAFTTSGGRHIGDDWAYGINAMSTVWVLDGSQWVGSLTVTDQALPWDIATTGRTQSQINGVDAVIDNSEHAVALRLEDGTRRIQGGTNGAGDADLMSAALELAEQIGTSPVAESLSPDRFVIPPTDPTLSSPVVRYGETDTIEVVTLHFARPPSPDEVRWTAASLAQGGDVASVGPNTFESTLPTGQRSFLELVSPVDAVSILAPAETNLGQLSNSLTFGAVEQTGLTLEDAGGPATPNVAARGESAWGRWQVARSVDGSCQAVTAAEWVPGATRATVTGSTTCNQAEPFSPVVCSSPRADTTLVVAIGSTAESVVVTLDELPISQTPQDGQGGAAVLINDIPPGPHTINVETGDGSTYTC